MAESLQPTDPKDAKNIPCAFEGAATVGGRFDLYIESIGIYVPLNQPGDPVKIGLVDIVKGDADLTKFGNRQQISN